MLCATSEIAVPQAQALLRRLCDHFAEHGEARVENGRGHIRIAYGTAEIEAREASLAVSTQASDAIALSYMKMSLAEHVVGMAEGPAPLIRWQGDGPSGGTPPFFNEMRLVSSRRLTPHMQRVRLSGEGLSRFAGGGLHVRLLFPPAGRAPCWPTLGEDGRVAWPQGEDALQLRVYTIRRVDVEAGLVDIDIVLHEGEETPGSRFALGAGEGQIVGMMGPGGGGVPEARSLLLVGDETALPAIARILEELPAEARARAVIEVDGPADEVALASPAEAHITFLHRHGAPAGTARLLPEALRAVDLDALGPDAFVWAGCEFSDFRAIRTYLRKERRMARERHLVAAYWRRGKAGDEARREA
ncbi:siderophore-interacting protein [Aureimonas populi]|uniref:DUF2218 domain-containing protein n=1 Tax=Aureimonas populi TaxID=1701758 RepID=A0ABW5CQB3_9HYPH|nr:siderophore-interacting protein [Aureimonas populi]